MIPRAAVEKIVFLFYQAFDNSQPAALERVPAAFGGSMLGFWSMAPKAWGSGEAATPVVVRFLKRELAIESDGSCQNTVFPRSPNCNENNVLPAWPAIGWKGLTSIT